MFTSAKKLQGKNSAKMVLGKIFGRNVIEELKKLKNIIYCEKIWKKYSDKFWD